MWRVHEDLLKPAHASEIPWEPDGPTRALCTGNYDPRLASPSPECNCGLWSLRDLDVERAGGALGGQGVSLYDYLRRGGGVFGRVRLWGAVMEYEHGWRSEFAQPVALYRCWDLRMDEHMDQVATAYMIPIEEPPKTLELWLGVMHEARKKELEAQQAGKLTEQQMQQWAGNIYGNVVVSPKTWAHWQALGANTAPAPGPEEEERQRTAWDWWRLRALPLMAAVAVFQWPVHAFIGDYRWWFKAAALLAYVIAVGLMGGFSRRYKRMRPSERQEWRRAHRRGPFSRNLDEGGSIPLGWGRAFRDIETHHAVLYPFGLHLLIRWGRAAYWRLANPKHRPWDTSQKSGSAP